MQCALRLLQVNVLCKQNQPWTQILDKQSWSICLSIHTLPWQDILCSLQHNYALATPLSFFFFFPLKSITTFVFWPFMASQTFFIVGCKRTFITIMQYTLMFCWNVFFQSVLACIPTITLFTVEPNVLMYRSNMNL